MIAEIILSSGEKCLVSEQDYGFLSCKRWSIHKIGNKKYAVHRSRINGVQKKNYMHRMIANPNSGMVVDHINGNGLDNRRSNLRVCTIKENLRNVFKPKNKKATSQFKGVSFFKRDCVWTARIYVHYKVILLGRFKTEIDAARAYNKKAIELFGEYANLNEVPT